MRSRRFSIGLTALLAISAAALLLAGAPVWAQTETVLHGFGAGKDAAQVNGGMVIDAVGNLYGTATGGGSYDNGAVFELFPQPGGSWLETVIYSFGGTPNDGILPNVAVTSDGKGNLYGTTTMGGANGYGTIYQLSNSGNGEWIERTIHSFTAVNGSNALPAVDPVGNLYSTTDGDGTCGFGTAFELSPTTTGDWNETILLNFCPQGGGGVEPGHLILDSAGNLYGAAGGGMHRGGVVFELLPSANGAWTETVLYSFTAASRNGYTPFDLVLDSAGNLYGAMLGGAYNTQALFKLTRTTVGSWTKKTLYSFKTVKDGLFITGLTLDTLGNLYGTTNEGGTHGNGTVFEVSSSAGEAWTEKVLHSFPGNAADGTNPLGNLALDAAGNLYGTTADGGIHVGGTVFQVIP
jgi:uncharacterized repeat protein (TIGR03803 family)